MDPIGFFVPPETDSLVRAMKSGDEGKLVDELKQLKIDEASRAKRTRQLIEILDHTNSARVRNAAAIAAADMRAEAVQDKLIELLTRSDSEGSRGTLLYALDELSATIPLTVLTHLIEGSSYEAREEALGFLDRGRFRADDNELSAAKLSLEVLSRSRHQERSTAAATALALLNDKET